MLRLRTSVLIFGLAALLVGCRAAPAESPTADPDSVIATSQAAAEMTRAAVTPTLPPTVEVSPSPTVMLMTPTISTTPTLVGAAVTASYNANVRDGPGVQYGVIDGFYQGQTARLVGRYVNGLGELWWYIDRIGAGIDGWVWDGAVAVTGDANAVPFLTPPPTPTPVPAATATATSTPTSTTAAP